MPRWMERHWGWISLGIFALILTALFMLANRFIPGQHLPWAKLNPDNPIGFGTKSQLMRLSLSPSETCMDMARDIEALTSIPADPKGPKSRGEGVCGWNVARTVYGGGSATLAPGEANMQCPLTIASYMWMREIDAIAQKRFDASLVKVHHMGTYSCRRQVGNGSGAWSEHAFANAWDIAAFELSDKTLIQVQRDWNGDKDRKAFLREVRDTACKLFKVTLSPDYNAAHADHFHVDMGPYSSCR